MIGVVVAVVVVLVVATAVWKERQPEWTTDSPQALAAFEEGLSARGKYYTAEARARFREALELDPSFAAAKVMVLESLSSRQKGDLDRLMAELEAENLDRLTPRERFLVRHILAERSGGREEARGLVKEYLRRNPRDPYALSLALTYARLYDDSGTISDLANRILSADPNWVQAYNLLGYDALARGDFSEAERMFTTYRYIAPDQANPHDSLAELYMLRGRYEEARAELEAALEVRPDFWFAYEHLSLLAQLQRDPSGMTEAAARAAAAGAPGEVLLELECLAAVWRAAADGLWEQVWEGSGEDCARLGGSVALFRFRAALATGRDQEAAALEQRWRTLVAEARAKDDRFSRNREAMVYHLEGYRRMAEGQMGAAAESFRRAEALLTFGQASEGHFKLSTLLMEAQAWMLAGESEVAREVLQKVREVNPPFADLMGSETMSPAVAAAS